MTIHSVPQTADLRTPEESAAWERLITAAGLATGKRSPADLDRGKRTRLLESLRAHSREELHAVLRGLDREDFRNLALAWREARGFARGPERLPTMLRSARIIQEHPWRHFRWRNS